MFIRFAQLEREAECRVAPGLFHALDRLPPYDGADWRHREIRHVYDGFNARLARPEVLEARMSRYGPRQGVCWFRDTAETHVSEARYLTWLLGDLGVAIRELRTTDPGTLIWADRDQIVVVPEPGANIRIL